MTVCTYNIRTGFSMYKPRKRTYVNQFHTKHVLGSSYDHEKLFWKRMKNHPEFIPKYLYQPVLASTDLFKYAFTSSMQSIPQKSGLNVFFTKLQNWKKITIMITCLYYTRGHIHSSTVNKRCFSIIVTGFWRSWVQI